LQRDWRDESNSIRPTSDYWVGLAASAQIYGAGNCDEHAAIAAFAYGGARLNQHEGRAGERVSVVFNERRKHAWAEAHAHPSAQNETPVVMDAWCEGPPVFAEDSRFADDREAVTEAVCFNLPHAARSGNTVRRLQKTETEGHAEWFEWQVDLARDRVRSEAGQQRYQQGGWLWDPQPVMGERFAKLAAQKLQDMGASPPARTHGGLARAVQVELQAVGVAMSLGVTGVAKLADEASKIVTAAQALVERAQGEDASPVSR
jgi:hypothetical protein